MRGVLPLIGSDGADVWVLEEGTWRVEIRAGAKTGGAAPTIEVDEALISEAARVGSARLEEGGACRWLGIALPGEDAPLGVLGFSRPSGGSLSEHQLEFLASFSEHVAWSLRVSRAWAESLNARRLTERRLRDQARELRRLLRSKTGLLGNHPSMQEAVGRIEQAARSRIPILLRGETGTGKEAAAALIHRLSRRSGPRVVVDCGAIPASLLESELFGHVKGAFTGASSTKKGRFEEAHGGTVFLDEIGEMPLDLQPRLLRALQEGTIRRIGDNEDRELDFRVISATNRDLGSMVEAGRFREDLFFRLRGLEIVMPPLRERGDDIFLLALYYLREHCAEVGRDQLPLSPDARRAILAHSWPGNVRELQNRMRQAAVMAQGEEVTVEDLQLSMPAKSRRQPPVEPTIVEPSPADAARAGHAPTEPPRKPASGEPVEGGEEKTLEHTLTDWFWNVWVPSSPEIPPQDSVEAFVLRTALQAAEGSVTSAAKLSNMHTRTFSGHLERLNHAALSMSIREHPLGKEIQRQIETRRSSSAEPSTPIMDTVLATLLREMFVLCRGNKSEMARNLGWSRQTLRRHTQRLGIATTRDLDRAGEITP